MIISSFIPSQEMPSGGGGFAILEIENSSEEKNTCKQVWDDLFAEAKKDPNFSQEVSWVGNQKKINYKIIRDGQKIETDKLTALEVVFGAEDWKNNSAFWPILKVVHYHQKEEEGDIYILLYSITKDIDGLLDKVLEKTPYKNAKMIEGDDVLKNHFFGESW